MLNIRSEQMEAFRRHRRQSFEDAVVAHIAAGGFAEAAVREWVRDAIPQALHLGFRAEGELLRLLVAQHSLRDSKASEEVSQIVADTELTTATRLALIESAKAARR